MESNFIRASETSLSEQSSPVHEMIESVVFAECPIIHVEPLVDCSVQVLQIKMRWGGQRSIQESRENGQMFKLRISGAHNGCWNAANNGDVEKNASLHCRLKKIKYVKKSQ